MFKLLSNVTPRAQVTNKVTAERQDAGLKGNLIFFPHEGPRGFLAALTSRLSLSERLDYLLAADLRVVMIGPNGSRDNLGKWLMNRDVLRLRADVCLLHSSIRRALDLAMDNPDPTPEIGAVEREEFLRRVESFPEELLEKVRHADSVAEEVERREMNERHDTAGVRHAEEDDQAMPAVAVLSSSDACTGTMQAAVDAARQLMTGNSVNSPDGDADKDADGSEEQPARDVRHPSQVNDAATSISRSSVPCSEFIDNGINLARLFRHVMPLLRVVRTTAADGVINSESWPLTGNSVLGVDECRHLLLQFTNIPANCQALICVLGNQMQRFSTIRSVGAAALTASFTRLLEVLGKENFWSELAHVCELMSHVATQNDKKVLEMQARLLPMFRYAGQSKPWGRQVRDAACSNALCWTVARLHVHKVAFARLLDLARLWKTLN